MPKETTIRISAVESIKVERMAETVKLTVYIGLAPVLSKHLKPLDALRIGEALGYAVNDIARPV